jgi:hypothetical protein
MEARKAIRLREEKRGGGEMIKIGKGMGENRKKR